MHKVVCPHCKARRMSIARPPKDVVVVMPCPSCHEWVVLFRDKTIALNRRIIERGTKKERVTHFAEVIAEFFEAGVFQGGYGENAEAQIAEFMDQHRGERGEEEEDSFATPKAPISQEELDRFLRIDLKCIDNPAYFKRHFG